MSRASPFSSETAHEGMLQSGMSPWTARVLTELYEVFAAGKAAETTKVIEQVTGKPARRFADFAHDFAGAFS